MGSLASLKHNKRNGIVDRTIIIGQQFPVSRKSFFNMDLRKLILFSCRISQDAYT